MKTSAATAQSVTIPNWICCQLGAREDYAIPRALQTQGLLYELITDVWATPGSWISRGTNGLSKRFHNDLTGARVTASNSRAVTFEITSRACGLRGWSLMRERNEWFQDFAVAHLSRHSRKWERLRPTVFAYSYAARRIFEFARPLGWRTVLGQIDPGPAEERIVEKLYAKSPHNDWQAAPKQYWDEWNLECSLSDHIVVNSDWARRALTSEGVPSARITVIPLALERFPAAATFERRYPVKFSAERPLRVLFLGQINLRKGVEALFDAIRLVEDEPIEFWLVGPGQVSIPETLERCSQIRSFGAVPRNKVEEFYRYADVFILPTFSDGFGLTQLEAQCWKLPIVASSQCGRVVRHGENGLLLEDISGEAIAAVLRELVRSPSRLQAMAAASGVAEEFSLKSLASSLLSL